MTNLGPISWLLGIKVTQDRKNRTITLSQQSYVDSILARFNFTDAKPLSIPMDMNVMFSKDQCPTTPDDIARMHRMPYHEAIGSLMYASVIYFTLLHLFQVDSTGVQVDFVDSRWTPPGMYLTDHICYDITWTPHGVH